MSIIKTIKCYICEAELDKNAIGLNKKLLGRNIIRYSCDRENYAYRGVKLTILNFKKD